ncbi:hypothetical protein Slin15195_G129240 [Septoria linicola]|uniref:Uncharacterized protein n=1 Tax=Septoria linicola TaxID=215465 RepID=A0A9Q9B7B5_9PEZI|nr:hypothetical protein Slin14017_G121770 [Septoria linicola]USW59605.1 hypothetical protein Slin15195_G129240 [Septoria linicola]
MADHYRPTAPSYAPSTSPSSPCTDAPAPAAVLPQTFMQQDGDIPNDEETEEHDQEGGVRRAEKAGEVGRQEGGEGEDGQWGRKLGMIGACLCLLFFALLISTGLVLVISTLAYACSSSPDVRPPAMLYDACSTSVGSATSYTSMRVHNLWRSRGQQHTVDFCTDVRARFLTVPGSDGVNGDLDYLNDLATVHPALVANSASLHRGETSMIQMIGRFQSFTGGGGGAQIDPIPGILSALETVRSKYSAAHMQALVVPQRIANFVDENYSQVQYLDGELMQCDRWLDWLLELSLWHEHTFTAQTLLELSEWEMQVREDAMGLHKEVQSLYDALTAISVALEEARKRLEAMREGMAPVKPVLLSRWREVQQWIMPWGLAASAATGTAVELEQTIRTIDCAQQSVGQHVDMVRKLKTSYSNVRVELAALVSPVKAAAQEAMSQKVGRRQVQLRHWTKKLGRFFVSADAMARIQKDQNGLAVVTAVWVAYEHE